jgi:nicotinamidase/pyrazinamidase
LPNGGSDRDGKQEMKDRWGVIVTDIQGDFTEWKAGALAVPNSGKDFVMGAEKTARRLKKAGAMIFGTQDWHPANHVSFMVNHPGVNPYDMIAINGRTQVLWPPHCIQGTENARVLVDNNLFLAIIRKGQDPEFESYSAFQDDSGKQTEMDSILRRNGIAKLLVYGIATDYCVKATALDAILAGYEVTIVKEFCRGITSVSTADAFTQMKQHGVTLIETLTEVLGSIMA